MSTVAIDTIDYVATDTYGDTATSKTTDLIVALSSTPPEPPAPDATTTQATSTLQQPSVQRTLAFRFYFNVGRAMPWG
jgi:hypothetical protein